MPISLQQQLRLLFRKSNLLMRICTCEKFFENQTNTWKMKRLSQCQIAAWQRVIAQGAWMTKKKSLNTHIVCILLILLLVTFSCFQSSGRKCIQRNQIGSAIFQCSHSIPQNTMKMLWKTETVYFCWRRILWGNKIKSQKALN
jgi:hypothetical protein